MGEFFTGLLATVGGLFLFGTLWFWVVSSVVFGWLIFLTEGEESHTFGAGLVLVGFVWIMSSVNDISVIANPLLWLKWVTIYLVLGVIWSVIKWFSFLHKQKDKLNSLKEVYIERNNLELIAKRISDTDWLGFVKYLSDQKYSPNGYDKIKKREDVIPTVKGRFSDLTRWIVWWPMSAFWTILNDPLRRIAEALVRALKGIYTNIANSVFSNEV